MIYPDIHERIQLLLRAANELGVVASAAQRDQGRTLGFVVAPDDDFLTLEEFEEHLTKLYAGYTLGQLQTENEASLLAYDEIARNNGKNIPRPEDGD